MARNLDTTMAPHLADGSISPAVMVELYLRSGVERVWSGIGDLVWNSKTFSGVGNLGSIGAITEASAVKAEGTSVTLSGIGLSQVALPAGPGGLPSPPFTPPAGQSVAWAFANTYGPTGTLAILPSIWNGGTGVSGGSSATASSGAIAIVGGDVFANTTLALVWEHFQMPPEVPPGATITGVYAYVVNSETGAFNQILLNGSLTVTPGTYISPNLHSISGVEIGAQASCSLPGGGSTVAISFIALAVYYEGNPLPTASLIYEALQDVWVGGPAKIWFGLMSGGTFIGNPYLVFAGTVDKPTVLTSPESSSVTLALENRLVNLQRPTNRRYTSADQHLQYPSDMGFNWMEILSDIALVWGN